MHVDDLRECLEHAVENHEEVFNTSLVSRYFDLNEESDREEFIDWFCDTYSRVTEE